MNATSTATTKFSGAWESIRQAVNAIATEIRLGADNRGGLSPGDLARLRRGENGPAFWKVAVRHLEPRDLLLAPGDPAREGRERRWTAILQGMAEMEHLHQPGLRLGQALAARDPGGRPRVADARVLRLLTAEGESLFPVVRGVVQQLAAAGQPVDWASFAELILSDAARDWGRRVRERVGLDYYRTVETGSRIPDREEERGEDS